MRKFIFPAKLTVILCLATLALGECSGPQSLESEILYHPSAALYVELGNWFIDHNQSACAVETFRDGLRFVPDSADLLYLFGLALDSSGNPKEAVAPLQQATRMEPKTIEYHLLLGSVFMELQQKNQAKIAFERALSIDSHSIAALDGLSKALIAQGYYQAVIKLLHSTRRDETLKLDLAQAYDKAHMYPQAVEVLLPVVREDPLSDPLTTELATLYLNEKRYPDAARIAGKSFLLHPNNMEIRNLYLRALVLDHDFGKARPLAQNLLLKYPRDFEVVYLEGVLEREAGQYDAARQYLEEAVTLNPEHCNAHYNLGIVLSELGDYAGAKEQLEKSLSLGAGMNEPQVRYRFASVLRAMGETEQAKKQFRLTEQELQATSSKRLPYQAQGC